MYVAIICGAIFILVAGLLVTIIIRFRYKAGRRPPQTFGNTKLEIMWATGPAIIVIILFIMTVYTLHEVTPGGEQRDADIVVIGHQWWWEIQYPKSGIITANELHIPVGKRHLVRIESADVIHSYWVPSLNSKVDAIPGHPNYMFLQADNEGIYGGHCTEFCGTQHAKMFTRVIAESPADFNKWERSQVQVAAAPASGLAAAGFRIYQQRACLNCHATSAGPDLNHVASRQTLGSGILPNNPANLKLWLLNPHQFKPGAHMPDFQLSEHDVDALVAYLETLR